MPLYFALLTVENIKNKKSVKLQGDTLNFCDFIQVFVFTTNHHPPKCTRKNQIEAARIVTGTTKLVSLDKLYQETGWETLEDRRK